MEKITNLIENNPVSFLISKNNQFNNTTLLDFLNQNDGKEYNKIYYIQPYDSSNYLLNNNKSCKFISCDNMIDLLLENIKKKVKLDIDIIIVDISYIKPIEIDLIFKLWSYLYNMKDIDIIPNLIIINYDDYISDIPFIVKNNVLDLKTEQKIETKIFYADRSFHQEAYDDIDYLSKKIETLHKEIVVKNDQFSTWLVLLPTKQKINMMKNNLKNIKAIDLEINTFLLNNQNDKYRLTKNKEGIRKILITRLDYIAGVNFNFVDGLFDSLQIEEEKNLYQYETRFISQREADKNVKFLNKDKGFCLRMITEKAFEDIEKFPHNPIQKNKLYKYYLKIKQHNLDKDPLFFNMLEDKDLKLFDHLHIIKNDQITSIGETLLDSPLSPHCTSLIHQAYDTNLPLYPIICMAVMIDQIKNKDSLLFVKRDTQKLQNIYSKNILVFYLNIWILFTKEFSTLDVDPLTVNKWARSNNINQTIFYRIHNIIKILITKFRENFDLELGYFNSQNLFDKSKNILEKIFKNSIFKFEDKDNKTYINNNDIVAEVRNISFNPLFEYPEKLIAYNIISTNSNNDECVITYFSPLD